MTKTKKRMVPLLALSLVAMLARLAAQDPSTFPARSTGVSAPTLVQLIATYWSWRLADRPELATELGHHEYDDFWRDWSPAARERARARRREFLPVVEDVQTGNLTETDRINANLMEYELNRDLDTETYALAFESLSPVGGAGGDALESQLGYPVGAHNQVFATIGRMPAETVGDYQHLLARIRALPSYVDGLIALWRSQLETGISQPAFIVERVIGQVAAERVQTAAESPLLAAFRRFPDDFSPADREQLRSQAIAAYDVQFLPSWTRLERFLTETYRPRARAEPGMNALGAPGIAGYATLVRYAGGTSMTPRALHDLGVAQLARIERDSPAVVSPVPADITPDSTPRPEFRRAFRAPAFSEGWRLYRDRNPSAMAAAAARLVVDTGIHALGWSRDQAVDYLMAHGSAAAAAEVENVVASPGLAPVAFLGERAIVALRESAARELGTRFEVRSFHAAILENGPLPLELVKQQVDRYVADVQRR